MLLTLQNSKEEIDIDLPPLDRAMQLAGFAFAQAAITIAEGAGPLVPLGYIERGAGLRSAERIMMRFTHPSAEDIDLALSVSEGRSAVAEKLLEYESTVLVYDGYVRRSAAPDKSDAFIVEINDVAFETPFKVIQNYQPFGSGGFKLLGLPVFLQDDHSVDQSLEAELAALFLDGIMSHNQARKTWAAWRG
jgi:hypothetical protein